MNLKATRLVLTILCLFACSCTKKLLSTICTPSMTSSVDNITLGSLVIQPKLPDGALVSWDASLDQMSVTYRDRIYNVVRREEGAGLCVDFKPPIPLADQNRSKAQVPGAIADQLATLLSDYWYVAVILTALLFWFFKAPSRKAVSADAPLLVSAIPEFADELEALLRTAGETDLAAQVTGLRIVDRCRCGDDFCSTFYVQPKPEGAYGPGHRNVALDPKSGMMALDVVDEKIAGVEVLYRDDVQRRLQDALP